MLDFEKQQPLLHSIAQDFQAQIADKATEHFIAAFIDKDAKVIGTEIIAKGNEDTVHAEPQTIAKRAKAAGAIGVVVGHNHPNQDARVSVGDVLSSLKLHGVLEEKGMQLAAALVVTKDKVTNIEPPNMLDVLAGIFGEYSAPAEQSR